MTSPAQKLCHELATALIARELDAGKWTGHDDKTIEAATRELAENIEESFRDSAYELNRTEPTYCANGRCGTCDGCVWRGDREYHEHKEAA